MENYGGRAIYSGDTVFLKAHTGNFVDVEGIEVQARWQDRGEWQRFYIERKDGSGAVLPGDTIFLRANTQKVVEVDGDKVQCRWDDLGMWQSLVIEKSTSRRLAETPVDESTIGALLGVAVVILGVIVLVGISALLRRGHEAKVFGSDYSYKVQPMQDEDAGISLH